MVAFAAIAALVGLLHSTAYAFQQGRTSSPAQIFRRQMNANSTCNAYGIDFQNGGSYFINTLSQANFTCVMQFEGCNNDTAAIMLVNDQASDQYLCSSVPTVPDDVNQMSTCPIMKSQMSSGMWSILALGNNANGNPFAWRRDFTLAAAPQQTTTIYGTITQTVSSTPLTSTIRATNIMTATPAEVTSPTTSTKTFPFTRWTAKQTTVTEMHTASCTIPQRPRYPDPVCRILPTINPVPAGWKGRPDYPVNVAQKQKRFGNHGRAAQPVSKPHHTHPKRDADAATITVTASDAHIATTTIFAPTSTLVSTSFVSDVSYITLPPATVRAPEQMTTVTGSAETDVNTEMAYTRGYVTKTFTLTWTWSVTTTPAASATACQKAGGHFGDGWEG
ncbi:hypothetical protein B0A48_13935 [Cryoendolithus antarcticus]|uniref:Uncharacterized protein n=1 Tax=Cryoendolithus antarcticus TaxID=1507870 RepID=A0A1V8SMB4_9PEZI|nr:hypothetical protein B0A48_13935 [Cryoendolithus antarcticus]